MKTMIDIEICNQYSEFYEMKQCDDKNYDNAANSLSLLRSASQTR